jgi:hypothetical protein
MADVSDSMVDLRVDLERFRKPTSEFAILPFWFLNGELDPDEMRYQLRELRDKGMHGVILHGRYGLEMEYLGDTYLERIGVAVQEARALGLRTWVYDEMNWPSGTADKRVLRARPDLAQRYIECISFTVQGPWFMCLTGEDSRYLDFERSTPVAAFAIGGDGRVLDLTPNLSFGKVVPWEVPPGEWRLAYVVEKRAEYYIDALDPESTRTFIELGYEPYLRAAGSNGRPQDGSASPNGSPLVGFYSDEPAMHYFLTGGDNPVVPWTKDMFGRFRDRNGYDLRPRLPDLFFDVRPDSGRVRHDFYTTLTDLYSNAYYRQLREWCRDHGVMFTAHLLYEEWLRRMIRVEGNLFRHYANMDVVAVDHLYPVIGTRQSPDQHVAIKVASSAAHQFGSPRLICESFGGIFMDATMQRMKWIADWEYVLGVNILNPHGFHYTLEGERKRDWPPSQFYQYPWWAYYQGFNDYISRLSSLLSGGRHKAKAAVLWPINAMFATYTPQARNEVADRMEQDFNALTDLLLRLHVEFDYLDEDVLAGAEISGGAVRIRDEEYRVVVVPPMSHVRLSTVERLEELLGQGGGALGAVMLPGVAFGPDGQVDVAERVRALFGVDPTDAAGGTDGPATVGADHPGGGRADFILADRIAGHAASEVRAMAESRTTAHPQGVTAAVREALWRLAEPEVQIDNEELFSLHREKEGRDIVFVVNPTMEEQRAVVSVAGEVDPVVWDPSTGEERMVTPSGVEDGRTSFELALPVAGSVLLMPRSASGTRVVESNILVETVTDREVRGYGREVPAEVAVATRGELRRLIAPADPPPDPLVLDGEWQFLAEDLNALVVEAWRATAEEEGEAAARYAAPEADDDAWLPMVPGAWSYQLPAEPPRPYPIPVWYRFAFDVEEPPSEVHLVLDGFAGEDVRLYLNGEGPSARPERSPFDSQMKTVDLTEGVVRGRNVVAVRLVVGGPTGGLLDRIKILGSFGLAGKPGAYRIGRSPDRVRPGSWTTQGHPFYSGIGVYRRTFSLPESYDRCRTFLEVPMRDDVAEIAVNERTAGVRLWDPYRVDVTGLVRPGENDVQIRVANTVSNLMNADHRPSGLAGPPRLVPYRSFVLPIPAEDEGTEEGSDGAAGS